MRCREAQERITELALGQDEEALDQSVLQHLRSCNQCASLARAHQLMTADLQVISRIGTPNQLDFNAIRQQAERRASDEPRQEINVMSNLMEKFRFKPRVGLSLAAVAVVILAAIFIPWQIDRNLGYELAVAGVDEGIISSGAMGELLAAVGLPDAEINLIECNPKCLVTISGLATSEEAQTAAAALKALPDVHISMRSEYKDKLTGRKITRSTSTQIIEDGRWTIEHGIDSAVEARVTIVLDSLVTNEPVTWTEWIHTRSDSTGMRNEVEKLANGGYRQTLYNDPQARLGWTKSAWTFDSTDQLIAYTITDSSGVNHDISFGNWAEMQPQLAEVGFFHAITYDSDGTPFITGTNADPATSGMGSPNLAPGMYLMQNDPNPFDTLTTIIFGLPETTHVKVTIYNHNSELVRTLVDDVMAAGEHKIKWDTRDDAGKRIWSWRQICKIEIGDYYHAISMAQVW